MTSSLSREAWSEAIRTVTFRPAGDETRAGFASPLTATLAASANSEASAVVSQVVSMTTPHAPDGPSTTASRSPPHPAAAAVAVVGRHAGLGQPEPELELAERVLQRDRPAAPEPGREIVWQGHRDRGLVRRVFLRMEDLLGRLGHPPEEGVHSFPAALELGGLDVGKAGRVRVLEDLPEEGRRPRQERLRRRVGADRKELQQVLRAEVGRGPERHEQHRVALVDGLPGEDPIGLVEDPLLVLEDREVLVLEGVVVFVGEGDPLVHAGQSGLGDHVQLSLVVPVEADDRRHSAGPGSACAGWHRQGSGRAPCTDVRWRRRRPAATPCRTSGSSPSATRPRRSSDGRPDGSA